MTWPAGAARALVPPATAASTSLGLSPTRAASGYDPCAVMHGGSARASALTSGHDFVVATGARLRALLARVAPAHVVLAGLVGVVVLVAVGWDTTLDRPAVGYPPRRLLDLDGELGASAVFSAALLLLAAAAALGWASVTATRWGVRWAALTALFFVFMASDEVVSVHERMERLTGLDWQLIYVPVVIAAAVPAVGLVFDLPDRRTRAVFLAGGAAWVGAQALEFYQWHDDVLVHPLAIIPEEALEMLGSLLWAAALLVAVSRGRRRAAAPSPAPMPMPPLP